MSLSARNCLLCTLSLLTLGTVGCNHAPRNALRQSQLRAHQLYEQNRQLAMERNGLGMTQSQLAAEKARLEQQYLATKQSLDAANARLQNLQASNGQLEDEMKHLLTSRGSSPLSDDATLRLKKLKEKYPDFEFDAQTGVSKFSTDLLFNSGSDEIRPEAIKVMSEFASIMNQSDAKHLKVLVSGHTDDRPVAKKSTQEKHQDNMGLSAHRALSVLRTLRKSGIAESRMGVSGYGQYQPAEPNKTEASRARNRRVEIFVLAPDATIAGWDPDPTMELR
ncbi:MAG: OmpA family protein [Planctomycetes bacterium]|nr:OmpA family protein [Planctomycetota bacterium]